MSIIKILPEHKSNTTIQFAPKRVFSSGSGGYTGSLNVIVNRSHTQKDNVDMREGLTNEEGPQKFDENSYEGRRDMIYNARFNTVGQGNIFSENAPPYNYELQLALLLDGANPADTDENGVFDDYSNFPPEFFKKKYVQLNLNAAHSGYSDLPMHPRNAYQLHISRSVPGTNYLHPAYRKKEIIRNILDPSYAVSRPHLGWGYCNFSCINFFETNSTELPVIVYDSTGDLYKPTNDLNVDFKLKVNYSPTSAGTILHLPGAFAVSVVTGSSVDALNRPTHYKLLLQLGTDSSGSIDPDSVDLRVGNQSRGNTQIYQSIENITSSYWHHCSIRYSDISNARTGSFYIDGRHSGDFLPTSSFSIASGLNQTAHTLNIGAFYTGSTEASKDFFNISAKTDQGVAQSWAISGNPGNYFKNPLSAEIHELKISDYSVGRKKVQELVTTPVTSSDGLLFHLPVLYTPAGPKNYYNAMFGDLLTETDSGTYSETLQEFYENIPVSVSKRFDSPFNTHHANIGGFLNINAQAFLMDFANGKYPYMHNLADNLQSHSSGHELSSSWYLFDVHQRRNTVIMPCDDGNFARTYDVYSGSHLTGSVVKADRPGILKLDNLGGFASNYDSKLCLVDEGWNHSITTEQPESAKLSATTRRVAGATPAQTSSMPSIRFFDPAQYGLVGAPEKASSLISIFSIPVLFYGNRLRPKSIKMKSHLYKGGGSIVGSGMNKRFDEGSDHRMEVNLCDDGYGNIIRCDTSGSVATANSVGTVYYEDGIIALKSPHMYSFGQHNYTLDFEGEQNTHILELLVPVGRNQFNSSSNPNYNAYKPLADANEEADSFIYLSTLNLHDSNLNVVGKARFAQPVIKRINDRYMIRVKFDF